MGHNKGKSMRRLCLPVLLLSLLAGVSLAQSEEERFRQFSEAFDKGLAELTARNFDESIAQFKVCIELYPDRPTAYYNIACAYSLNNQVDLANDYLRQALERGFNDPDHIEADTDLDNIRNSEGFLKLIAKFFRNEDVTEAYPAPAFTLKDLQGNEVDYDSFEGKIIILDFWATWCGPCRREIPHLIELMKDERYKDKLAVVGVSFEDAATQAPFAEKHGINYTLLINDSTLPAPFSEINAIPTTFVIDTERNVVRQFVGYQEKNTFEQVLNDLLDLSPSPDGEDEGFFK